MRRIASLLLLLAVPCGVRAAAATGGAGAVQLNAPASARLAGMGDVSAGARDVLGAWSNPAALASLDRQGEVALVGGPVLAEAKVFGLGAGYRLTPQLTVGFLGERYGLSLPEVDEFGDQTDQTLDHAVLGAGLLAAYEWRWLKAGLALKAVTETLLKETTTGGALDLGVIGAWGGGTVSLALRHAGAALQAADAATGAEAETMPVEVRVGAGWTFAAPRLVLGVETAIAKGRKVEPQLGAEWWFTPMFALRVGGGGLPDEARITAGFSALWNQFGLDYGIAAQSIGAQHRIALSYGFGAPRERAAAGSAAAPEPPREEPAPKDEAPLPAPVAGAKKLNFAIADLRAENVSAGDAAVMADLLRNELVKTGNFNVVEKQNMDKVLAEHAFQQTGCSSEECAVKLGKLLNVQRMAVGSFGKLLDSYFLNVRVVDIETGSVVVADAAEGTTVAELKKGVFQLARRLAKAIH